MKRYSLILPPALLVTLLLTLAACTNNQERTGTYGSSQNTSDSNHPARTSSGGVDFIQASDAAIPTVVHIKTRFNAEAQSDDPFASMFEAPTQVPMMASGSGVIINADGYIATNNHVVENAENIDVVLPDRRSFPARLIGRDPNTDLALVKIDAKNLPAIRMGNSDNVRVGEWVLAVGYPLSLNSTVTAGIISAKGRSIGIINSNSEGAPAQGGNRAIESFLQTDAAINPGNSGGALVNTAGELIGINSAIASQTGSYAGYGFAIPINLVKKVMDDLKQYGTVKRAVLGISYPSPAAEDQYLQQQGLTPGSVKGVYVIDVQKGSAAAAAGLQEGDIIQSIDGVALASSAEFSERIARHRPGDKVSLTYLRKGKSQSVTVALKGEETAQPQTALNDIYTRLGATFAPLSSALAQRYNLRSGVVVKEVRSGGFFDQIGIPAGTIIAMVNGKSVNSPQQIEQALMNARSGNIQILGVAPDGSRVAFNFSLGT